MLRLCLIISCLVITRLSAASWFCSEVNLKPADFPIPEMVKIKGGVQKMGQNNANIHGEKNSENETPQHNVSLDDFYISKTEVTVKQYYAFVKETKSHFPEWAKVGSIYNIKTGSDPKYKNSIKGLLADEWPIVGVCWMDAVAYCEWLSLKTGQKYRLPTEAEWEYAARGGTLSHGYLYAGDNMADYHAWYDANTTGFAHETATQLPNECELFDMSGNVAEWCYDWYDANYYQSSPDANPKGPNTGTQKVVRGGSFSFDSFFLRVTARMFYPPEYTSDDVGFRVVRIP